MVISRHGRGRLQAALCLHSRRAFRRWHAPSPLPRRPRLMPPRPPEHPPSVLPNTPLAARAAPPAMRTQSKAQHIATTPPHNSSTTPRIARGPTFTRDLQFRYTRCDVPFPLRSQPVKHLQSCKTQHLQSPVLHQPPAPSPPASASDPPPSSSALRARRCHRPTARQAPPLRGHRRLHNS